MTSKQREFLAKLDEQIKELTIKVNKLNFKGDKLITDIARHRPSESNLEDIFEDEIIDNIINSRDK